MTHEAKALPDWKPEDGCVPDEWLVALRDNRLTDHQRSLLSSHPWCVKCMRRYGKFVRDVSAEWLGRAVSSDLETLMTWKPEDGCIPIELLLAIDMELFSEETELRLCAHLAGCPACDHRLSHLPPAKPKGPTLMQRLRKVPRSSSDDGPWKNLDGESSGLEP